MSLCSSSVGDRLMACFQKERILQVEGVAGSGCCVPENGPDGSGYRDTTGSAVTLCTVGFCTFEEVWGIIVVFGLQVVCGVLLQHCHAPFLNPPSISSVRSAGNVVGALR
ncbi:hypothetical protein MKZ38_009321 [Zalerion maritima]|uniref:Uncharacterized protein n=1 Tax=Zalerion maritima TaxID=339359 RepID=A0AAD5RGB4_9PEZI|nr:hypothetical protein MKZ38_009321 [Zalerion maritima]